MRNALLFCAVLLLVAVGYWQWPRPSAPLPTMADIYGRQHPASAWRGHVVVINFWATDCLTCRHELPQWALLWRQWHTRGLEIVAIAMQYDQRSQVLDYAEQMGLPFTVVYDRDGALAHAFGGVEATPTSVLIDAQGHIDHRYLGEVPADEFSQWLHQALPGR